MATNSDRLMADEVMADVDVDVSETLSEIFVGLYPYPHIRVYR